MFCERKSIYTYNQYHRRATCWLPQGTVTHTFFTTINIIVMKILVYEKLTNKQVSLHPISWRKALLVFAVVEIFFFTAARMVLFWICDQTVLTAHPCFHCCWALHTQPRDLLHFLHCPISGWGCIQDSWPHLTKGISHNLGCPAQQ